MNATFDASIFSAAAEHCLSLPSAGWMCYLDSTVQTMKEILDFYSKRMATLKWQSITLKWGYLMVLLKVMCHKLWTWSTLIKLIQLVKICGLIRYYLSRIVNKNKSEALLAVPISCNVHNALQFDLSGLNKHGGTTVDLMVTLHVITTLSVPKCQNEMDQQTNQKWSYYTLPIPGWK